MPAGNCSQIVEVGDVDQTPLEDRWIFHLSDLMPTAAPRQKEARRRPSMLRQSGEQHASGLPNGEIPYGTRAGARSDPSNGGFGLDIRSSGHRVRYVLHLQSDHRVLGFSLLPDVTGHSPRPTRSGTPPPAVTDRLVTWGTVNGRSGAGEPGDPSGGTVGGAVDQCFFRFCAGLFQGKESSMHQMSWRVGSGQ